MQTERVLLAPRVHENYHFWNPPNNVRWVRRGRARAGQNADAKKPAGKTAGTKEKAPFRGLLLLGVNHVQINAEALQCLTDFQLCLVHLSIERFLTGIKLIEGSQFLYVAQHRAPAVLCT